jgi:hypothetical protein
MENLYASFLELGPQWDIKMVGLPITFNLFNTSFGYDFLSSFLFSYVIE